MRTEKKIKSFVLLTLLMALWLALSGCTSLNGQLVIAECKNYNAIGPRQKKYIAADPALKPEDKVGYTNTVETWQEGLLEAAKEVKGVKYDPAADRFEFDK